MQKLELTVTVWVACGRYWSWCDVVDATTNGNITHRRCSPMIVIVITAVPSHRSSLQWFEYPAVHLSVVGGTGRDGGQRLWTVDTERVPRSTVDIVVDVQLTPIQTRERRSCVDADWRRRRSADVFQSGTADYVLERRWWCVVRRRWPGVNVADGRCRTARVADQRVDGETAEAAVRSSRHHRGEGAGVEMATTELSHRCLILHRHQRSLIRRGYANWSIRGGIRSK